MTQEPGHYPHEPQPDRTLLATRPETMPDRAAWIVWVVACSLAAVFVFLAVFGVVI